MERHEQLWKEEARTWGKPHSRAKPRDEAGWHEACRRLAMSRLSLFRTLESEGALKRKIASLEDPEELKRRLEKALR